MNKINSIIDALKKEVDKLKTPVSPKIIFIGGPPGAGKELLIEKTKSDFSSDEFEIIEADLYRKYYKNAKTVEETVEETNKIELEILLYALSLKKNIIHISSLRSFEYISELIEKKIIPQGYDVFLYVIATNNIECSISTYERYIVDRDKNNCFPRLNKYEYLETANQGFKSAVDYFEKENKFKEIHVFRRGKNKKFPVEIYVGNKKISTAIKEEIKKQLELLSYKKIKLRIDNIEKKLLSKNEKKEFDKIKNKIINSFYEEKKGDKDMHVLNKKTEAYAKNCFNKAIDLGVNFKLNNKVSEKHFDTENMNELLKLPLNQSNLEEILKEFEERILPYCTNFSSEKFMGFPDAGNSISGMTGAIISDFMQQNLINSSFCAPIATFTEIAVINWLREIIGYNINPINNIWDVGGIITYGGTGSNTTAMLLARENYNSNTMVNGVENPKNYKIIIPKGTGHYSIRSASMWIGCGDNIIEVDTIDFKYDLKKLKKALEDNKDQVMCVVVYVGDSRTMTIDNLREIHDLVKSVDKNIWLHADACHGFSLAFSEKLRDKIKGLELYDSISTDPHKVLAIPYCISALLVKDPEKMKLITSTSDLIMQEDFAYGQITPFIGSKSWVSLKLWFAIKSFGIKGYGKLIEQRCKIAKYLKEQITKSNEFIVLNDVNINSVVFMYVGNKKNDLYKNIDYLNKLNLSIYEKLLDEGEYYLHKFSIPDSKGIIKKDVIVYPLRYMSGNDNINEQDINKMLLHIKEIGEKIENE